MNINTSLIPNEQPRNRLSRHVRFNGLHLIAASWDRISRTSKVLLLVSLLIVIAQIATTVVILIVARDEHCDKPLEIYLIVYVVRVAVATPFLVYQHLHRPVNVQSRRRRRRRGRQHGPMPTQQAQSSAAVPSPHDQNQHDSPVNGPTTGPPVTSESSSTPQSALSNTPDTLQQQQQQQQQQQPLQQNSTTAGWVERIKTLLDLFAVLWFIIGNYFIFTSSTCNHDAPALFYTTLTWVLLGYLLILIPLFLCASVIFCLPCVLVAMRAMNLGVVPGMMGGTQEEINKVPVYRFVAENATGSDNPDGRPEGSQTPSTPHATETAPVSGSTKPRRSLWQRLTYRVRPPAKSTDNEEGCPDISITPADDAMCSICLSEYEQGDLLCKLWCGHHFHKTCVHEWLVLNSKCPLCKQDFRGKEYDEEDDDDE